MKTTFAIKDPKGRILPWSVGFHKGNMIKKFEKARGAGTWEIAKLDGFRIVPVRVVEVWQ